MEHRWLPSGIWLRVYNMALNSRCSSAIRSLRLSCSAFSSGVQPVNVTSRSDSICCWCSALISVINSARRLVDVIWGFSHEHNNRLRFQSARWRTINGFFRTNRICFLIFLVPGLREVGLNRRAGSCIFLHAWQCCRHNFCPSTQTLLRMLSWFPPFANCAKNLP